LVTGNGSTWTNSNYLSVGDFSSFNRMQIDNGGKVFNTDGYIGGSVNGGAGIRNSNSVFVTGNNSLWQNNGNLLLGYVASGGWNQLGVSNGARVVNSVGYVGYSSGSNSVLVTGAGSTWSNTSTLYLGYLGSQSNRLVVADGGTVRAVDTFVGGPFANDKRNSLLVTDSNSLLQASSFFYVGWVDGENDLVIANGGRVNVTGTGQLTVLGEGASSRNNTGLVTGSGSTLSSVSSGFFVGDDGAANRLTISNGGLVSASATVTAGNTASASNNSVFVTANGVLETATGLRAGSAVGNSISNVGGVYQFTTATPTITPNGAGRISIANGTISYRGVTAANVANAQMANISFAGNNGFKLDNSTNTSLASYTFDSVANTGNAANYQKLILANGARWQSTSLMIGSGGVLVGNGTVASVNVTNLGAIAPGFSAGSLTFTSNLVLGASSQLQMEIGGASLFDYDQLIVGGNVTVTGTLAIAMINSFSPTPGETFTLIDNQGANPISGQFNGLTNNAFIDASGNGSDAFFTIHYDGGTGNDLVLVATIPEPSAVSLLWFGLGWFLLFRQRNRK
jgi:T5SS/PEP-CTERM-associated repeat protein